MPAANKPKMGTNRRLPVGVFLASLFVASALLRLGDEDARAIASEALSNLASSSENNSEDAVKIQNGSTGALLAELRAQKHALSEREQALMLREKDLEIVALEVERRLRDLEATEERLSAALHTASGIAAADLERMTEMYSAMKPKQAAALFAEMEPGFAAGFLRQMDPDIASLILGEMDPASAYTLSVVLAGQHQDLPPQ